ncbi:hypothetical protein [Iodobacter fluviatilis]|uniref:Uncharacterized protein n=1 Tax=Iodobacter fluviatilis TaxID=537 RepID=A0A377SUF4_9NEIS|nr:hypothetical protein [Iodobacter fluviatilis]TCU88170.1 hypothetical protein EV682_104344 [Iodobacter fluviatilis]STR45671.1 Uncharacterised protein [Iodobacter fluviatilis]
MNLLFVWIMILIPGLIINFVIHKWCLKKQTKKSSEIWLLIINGVFLSPLMGIAIFSNSDGGYGAGLGAVLISMANTGLSVLFIIYAALSDRPEQATRPLGTANPESDQL